MASSSAALFEKAAEAFLAAARAAEAGECVDSPRGCSEGRKRPSSPSASGTAASRGRGAEEGDFGSEEETGAVAAKAEANEAEPEGPGADEVEGDAAADVVDERVVVVEESVADDDDRLSLNAHEDDEQLDYD